MGMDVMGMNATSEKGEYFRNNVWWWRPLWDYCLNEHGDIAGQVEHGHSNDGDGLDGESSHTLGLRLLEDVKTGRVAEYKQTYDKALSELPRVSCDLCNSTGIRTDKLGLEMKMNEKELDEASAIILGRTHGYCNACHGYGTQAHFGTNYPFDVDNVQEFAEFLVDCGGFQIC
jgi:hypothetical protein